jgi:hypothetical protein
MWLVQHVSPYFKKTLITYLEKKGVSSYILDEIKENINIKKIIVEDTLIQRDLLYWLDKNTTVILKRICNNNFLACVACLYIGEIDLIRNLYICRLYENRMILLSPFPDVEKAILSKIQELEREYGLNPP